MTKKSCDFIIDVDALASLQIDDPEMYRGLMHLLEGQQEIIDTWVETEEVSSVLLLHGINPEIFKAHYAFEVFSYFAGVIAGVQQVGDCPVMATFLDYLKDRDVSMDELYTICTYFRKAMLDRLCASDVNVKQLFGEISFLFDKNFAGVLKVYAERLHAKEEALAKNTKLLNAYKNAIDESAVVSKTDEHGIITYVNDRFVEVCGYQRDELVGFSHNITRHPETSAEFFEELWHTIEARRIFRGTMQNLKKNGQSYYMDLTIVPIYDPVKEVTEYMGIGYEVTRLVEARQEAEMAGKAKAYFLSNMSHEIRTPLNAILGFVTLLIDENRSQKHQQYLDIIYNSGENLLGIINDILDFSKLRSGEFTVERRAFNLHDELIYTLELFAPGAHEKRISLFSFIDPKIPRELLGDPLRMKQILSNFLSNAIKFTPFGGCIDIAVELHSGMLQIAVRDNGNGISKADQQCIFNAFSQGENAAFLSKGGTGLGLAICRELAEHMGGSIDLESEYGKGSCFTLCLPVECNAESECLIIDTAPFTPLRPRLLEAKRQRPEIIALLQRYWREFDLKVENTESLDAEACDLLFFIDGDTDDTQRQEIITSKIPAIAIMESIQDIYDDVPNVTPLYFPLYCMKLYNAMGEALGMVDPRMHEQCPISLNRCFQGKVLVAEDNGANRELIRLILQRYGLGYRIVTDGCEAVECFKTERFDMVLMDEQMPCMSGKEALWEIRRFEAENDRLATPIVAVTANVLNRAKEEGIRNGYDAFVGKPIVLKDLESIFECYLSNAEPRPKPMMEHTEEPSEPLVQGLDMEKLRGELMLDDQEIVMLLEVFLNKATRVMQELEAGMLAQDFKGIATAAHQMKGSSANFRLERMQSFARAMEEAAMEEDATFDYAGHCNVLAEELANIKIVS